MSGQAAGASRCTGKGEQKREVIRDDFSSWLPAKERKGQVLGVSQLAGTSSQAGEKVKGITGDLRLCGSRHSWLLPGSFNVKSCIVMRSRKNLRSPILGRYPDCPYILFFRAPRCFSAFPVSALRFFPPPQSWFCAPAPRGRCAEHGAAAETPGRAGTVVVPLQTSAASFSTDRSFLLVSVMSPPSALAANSDPVSLCPELLHRPCLQLRRVLQPGRSAPPAPLPQNTRVEPLLALCKRSSAPKAAEGQELSLCHLFVQLQTNSMCSFHSPQVSLVLPR